MTVRRWSYTAQSPSRAVSRIHADHISHGYTRMDQSRTSSDVRGLREGTECSNPTSVWFCVIRDARCRGGARPGPFGSISMMAAPTGESSREGRRRPAREAAGTGSRESGGDARRHLPGESDSHARRRAPPDRRGAARLAAAGLRSGASRARGWSGHFSAAMCLAVDARKDSEISSVLDRRALATSAEYRFNQPARLRPILAALRALAANVRRPEL